MRKYALWLYCLFHLTSCAYYGDMHSHATPISLSDLSSSHIYAAANQQDNSPWWNKLQDPLLDQLITTALADSPTMQIAATRVQRAQAIVQGAVAPMWPSIDFSGYVQRQKFGEFGLIPPPFNAHTYDIGETGFNFNYEFDIWGKNRQMLAARVSEQCAEQADLAEARLIISAAVADTYFRLLDKIAQTKLAQDNLQLTTKISKIVMGRASSGIESDIPVKTAIADAEAARLATEQFKQTESLLRNQLAVLLGKNPFTTDIVTQNIAYRNLHIALPTSLPANLLAQRPDINAAKLRAEAAAHQINVAKSRFFPNISLTALFSYQSVGLGHLFDVADQNNSVTGAVDLPIFDAGARRANLGVKYAEYDLAVTNYNQTLLTALREVADQLAILKSLKAQLNAQNEALHATSHNYKLFKSRYNHGIIDYVKVLEIKKLLLQQQAQQVDLQTRHLQAVVAMYKALGASTNVSAINNMSAQG